MLRLVLPILLLAACGAGGRELPDAGPTADAMLPLTAVVKGTVWAPGNAPGQVSTGSEIPVANAVIYAVTDKPEGVPQEVYCDRCQELVGFNTTSDAKGAFQLQLPAGRWWIVIQKGQFRRDHELTVGDFQTIDLTTEQTTLPSDLDPLTGKWIPHIAIGVGHYDDIQDILGKMGLGTVDSEGILTSLAASDNVDLYLNGVPPTAGFQYQGTFDGLLGNLPQMKKYHVIFVPCTDNEEASPIFTNPQIRQNIRDYVAAGGKLYVTDWSAEWEDVPFPDFIQFADHDNTSADCSGTGCASGDGSTQYTVLHGTTADDDLTAWLDGQKGPMYVEGMGAVPVTGTYDATDFVILGAWDKIASLPTVTLGSDSSGNPILGTAKTWVSGDPGERPPMTVTFETGGCGRVLYSTYHTADAPHPGLVPQERILLYLIMELGICNDNVID